ncbi:uncharacterized protein BDW70DRAFT_145128 [Aspergillus foveolatus]|uniref:uncharacterized protein n=1 Tax=Aspergillus foveolatus TaxID=210207 RepID=UPI003CCC9971
MARSKQRKPPSNPSRDRIVCGPGPTGPDIPIDRTEIRLDRIRIFGWPSRGGVIVLAGTTRADFEYLGWNALDPPLRRDKDQDAEDAVCKKLLLLGATWFDSQSRFKLLAAVLDNSESICELFYDGKAPGVTRTESMWVTVGWPRNGGLWVGEFSNPRFEAVMDKDAECFDCDCIDDSGLLGLAKDMEERCEILKKIGGKFYASLDDYNGHGCLRAWEDKTTGEVGPLVVTRYQE